MKNRKQEVELFRFFCNINDKIKKGITVKEMIDFIMEKDPYAAFVIVNEKDNKLATLSFEYKKIKTNKKGFNKYSKYLLDKNSSIEYPAIKQLNSYKFVVVKKNKKKA